MRQKFTLLLITVIISTAVMAQDYLTNLVFLYQFEDNLTDYSDNKSDATANAGTVTFADGKVGKAAVFDGASDLLTPEGVFDPSAGPFTFIAWCYGDTGSSGNMNAAQLLAKAEGDGTGRLILNRHANSSTARTFLGGNATYSDTTVALGEWYHYALTGDPADSTLTVYLNGKLAKERNIGTDGFHLEKADSVIVIGSSGKDKYWKGMLDEIALFSVELTAANIDSIFKNGIVEDEPEAIEDINLAQQFKIVNPVENGSIQITSNITGITNVKVFNLLGKTIYEGSFGSQVINIRNAFEPGYYIISFENNNRTASKKIIIK